MIPSNITKEHILKAIAEIDEKGVRKGRHSSTYDLVHNGKRYPPKLVISIANRFANGEELKPSLFPGGVGTQCFEILEGFDFEVVSKNDPVQKVIADYKAHIAQTRLEDEKYKWELIEEYRGRPNTSAEDFDEEIKSIDFSNLIFRLGIGVIRHLSREKPEELRELFVDLFDESKDLTNRVKA
ncbi:hypothetical protein OAE48_03645, partial [Flavobacteriales bacterium]|nr:hypothetical protein [Flavobacteriales bacterium]